MPQQLRRIVVTGAAGFIGSHLVDRLLEERTNQVVAVDNFSRGRAENLAHLQHVPRFRLIEADIRDAAAITTACAGASIVYHLAAQPSVVGAARNPTYTFQTNVLGTFNVLRAAAECGVGRLVFASSREVYGEPIALPVHEEAPLLAVNSYGASKVAGEAYCRAFRRESGIQTVILRITNVYGPRDERRLIPLWLGQCRNGQEMLVYGGKQVMDVVWIGHVVEALARAGAGDGPLPPINIGSGTGTRIVDLARRIGRVVESQPRIKLQPARPMEVTRFVANVERMRRLLLLEPPLDPLGNLADVLMTPGLVLS